MIRTLSLALVALLLTALPAFAADDTGRHSGRVVDIRDGGKVLVLEEMGPWLGPNTGLVRRSIQLGSATPVRLIRPTGQWVSDTSPGYEMQALDVRDLKPGDFITVIIGGGRAAAALDVMRADEAGLASPKLDSGQ